MTLNLHRTGSGPPLLLLHGVGHRWQGWRPVIELLEPRFDVLAVDLPGFGASPPLAGGAAPSIPALTAAIRAELDRLGVARPHVAGNSLGGAIALELALAGHARSATAFSPAGFWNGPECRFCQLSLGALARPPAALRPALLALARRPRSRAALFAQLVGAPRRVAPENAAADLEAVWGAPAMLPALRAFGDYRFAARPVPPGVPVTVAWGARDRLLPARLQAPRARRALGGARHVLLDTGHVPFTDDPAAVARTITTTARALSGR